jgi:N-acetylneuraminate synthase
MCDYDDIERALKIFSKNISSSSLTLMHCVGTYPCAEEDLNLQMIPTLQKRYIYPVGYSGHEASVSPSVIAAALGATAIERHITLDRSMYGSDQAASLEPHGFKTMVDQIRKLPAIMGTGIKTILPAEAEVAKKLRYWL